MVVRFWFFGSGGRVFIATAECSNEERAKRLAAAYNSEPGPLGPVDFISDSEDPATAQRRINIEGQPKTGVATTEEE